MKKILNFLLISLMICCTIINTKEETQQTKGHIQETFNSFKNLIIAGAIFTCGYVIGNLPKTEYYKITGILQWTEINCLTAYLYQLGILKLEKKAYIAKYTYNQKGPQDILMANASL